MKVDTKKFFAALFTFCATVIAIGYHDYNEADGAMFETIAKSLLLFMGALPFMLLYRNILSRQVAHLSNKIDAQTEILYETTNLLEEKVEEKTKELIDEGFEDSLTHLSNRHRLMFDMDRYVYRTLIIIHLQNFKELNYFFGKTIGDSLLQQFGLWLERMNYNAYRLGSDEFSLLIEEELSPSLIATYCETFVEQLSQHTFTAGLENVSLLVAMGVDVGKAPSLMHADVALQSAMEMSKIFALYNEQEDIQVRQHHNIQTATNIREAFHAGRIICYYQPIISIQTGKVEKYETLARLINPDTTIIPPLNFLDVAKKTALYPQITQEIIRQACEAFQDRQESFSVHVGALDIMNYATIRFIEEMVVITNTAHRIVFELPEDDIYAHFGPVSLFIQHMKRMGAKIAIDNFGSTYSNLDKILQLEIDYLKIDGSLVKKITHSPRHTKIVQTIASFADALGAKAIAENVETIEILEHITTAGIHFAQGNHIGKPGPCCFEEKH
jgi:EAL domain-containing protein (putative c-di-GMP-specific phosphodiesterase class I)/GGDEF domain-containing protein